MSSRIASAPQRNVLACPMRVRALLSCAFCLFATKRKPKHCLPYMQVSMNWPNMSSTTEESDWEATIRPQARLLSTNGPNHGTQKTLPVLSPQPIIPREAGPGQLVFPLSSPTPNLSQNSGFGVLRPVSRLQFVNHAPLPFTPPVNPALTRVINDTLPHATSNNGNISRAPSHQPESNPAANMPENSAPPGVRIRGVRSGAKRARGGGRGGTRGGRKSKVKAEPTEDDTVLSIASTPVAVAPSTRARGKGRGRGGRARGGRAGASNGRGTKRKREEEDEKNDSDVSEIITPLPTQSRSGRKITHANNFSPVVIDLEIKSESSNTVGVPKASIPASGTTSAPKQRSKRGLIRPGETSVCKNCGRGYSPASNMIVFCDGCNDPWHRFCHDPPISIDVIQIEEREWFCANCQVLREEKAHVEGKVSAEDLNIVEVSLSALPFS